MEIEIYTRKGRRIKKTLKDTTVFNDKLNGILYISQYFDGEVKIVLKRYFNIRKTKNYYDIYYMPLKVTGMK